MTSTGAGSRSSGSSGRDPLASGTCRIPGHGEDASFSETAMDVTLKGVGRLQMVQVAVRRWKNGKVVHERFYHK
jgi:hypothetical protein